MPISTAVCFAEAGKKTLGCFDRRPIQNRPLKATNLLRLAKFENEPMHRCAAVRTLLYCVQICRTRMMLPLAACAAGGGYGVVCVICVSSVASTMLGVCLGRDTQVEVIGNQILEG